MEMSNRIIMRPRCRSPPFPFLESDFSGKEEQNVSKKYHIKLGGRLIPVSEDVYRAYKQPQWREKKQKIARRKNEISYEHMLEKGFVNQADPAQCSLDEIVFGKMLIDELHEAIATLSDDERNLIYALYYQEKSEREVAVEIGISCVAVHKRKIKAIEKLKLKINK